MKCHNCNEIFKNDDGSTLVFESLDPFVQKRRAALQPFIENIALILNELQSFTPFVHQIEEDEYRSQFVERSQEYLDQSKLLIELLSTVDFRSDFVITDEFSIHLEKLTTAYKLLFEITKHIISLSPTPTWITLHTAFVASVKLSFQSYLEVVDVLQADDFIQAQNLMQQITRGLDEAGQVIEEIREVVIPGKTLRYGQASNLSEAIAMVANEEMDIVSWQRKGWNYFKDILHRDITEIPQEHGFNLAILAIITESFNSSVLLKERASAIAGLLRSANVIDPISLQAATNQVDADIVHAARLLFDIGLQGIATNFSKLYPQQKFNIAIHAYQRMSEGSFNHLLNIILFSERLIEGIKPNYDDISKMNFGPKVRRTKPKNAKGIADSSNPIIAGLADSLVMYVRHADAHCDFYVKSDKVIINERDRYTKQIVATHEYTEQEFTELIQELLEAVFAIMVGIMIFRVEHFEDYLTIDPESLLEYERAELCKYIFATKGIIVESIEQVTTSQNKKTNLVIRAFLVEGATLSPTVLVVPYAATFTTFSNVNFIITELYENENLLGTITVPSSHFQKYGNSSRLKELTVLDLTYNLLTRYTDPPNLLNNDVMDVNVYHWKFLKAAILYLHHILMDCYNIVDPEVKPTPEQLKSLNQELTLLQNIVVTNSPPEEYHSQYTYLLQAISIGKEFIWLRQLSARPKNKNSKDFKAVLGRAEPIRKNLLDFVILKETEKAP